MAGALAVLATGLLFGVGASPVASATSAVTGSAYGYRAFNMTFFGGSQPDTGPTPTVTLASDASNSPQSASARTGLVAYGGATMFTSDGISLQTAGSLGTAGSVTTSSSVHNINKATTQPGTGSEPLTANRVRGCCSASAAGTTGSTTITKGILQTDNGLDLNNDGNYTDPGEHSPVSVTVRTNPAPNATISGHIHLNSNSTDYVHDVFNEQATDTAGNLTVNPVHEYFDRPTATGNLVIGQVVCGTTVTTVTNPAPAESRLFATWVNTKPTIKQIVLAGDGSGGLFADVFADCTAVSCELGKAPAVVFSTSKTATAGTSSSSTNAGWPTVLSGDGSSWSARAASPARRRS